MHPGIEIPFHQERLGAPPLSPSIVPATYIRPCSRPTSLERSSRMTPFSAYLPFTGIGQIAVDRNGNVYLTDPEVSSRIFHIDQAGNVTVFADASKGLIAPYGLAIDSRNNLFVANNPGSSPAFILKFDPSGTVTSFAINISFQPSMRSMTFDDGDNLYATLEADNTILKFDRRGNSSVFATASKGLNNPIAVTVGTCPVDGKVREGESHFSEEP